MFEEIEEESFSAREERIQRFWKENDIFKKSLREELPLFSTNDGPPFATGLPHYGHLLAGTIKDVVPRYKTMKGYFVPRRFGWDCHGLPVENIVEKAHNLSGAPSIERFGVASFNEECRKVVLKYSKEWEHTVERMGRWIDFSETWKTMDISYMESVWWVFKQVYEKGLIYEGHKVMPVSAQLGTPISNFEASENYKEVDDPSLVVKFEVEKGLYFLAWTTTPWTLVSNLALSVGPDIDYVCVNHEGEKLILAEAALGRWFKKAPKVEARFKGSELVGKSYKPLFPYFSDRAAFRVIGADFVSVEDGTGIVHTAPGFGEDDFYACQKAGLPVVCPVDNNGIYSEEVKDFAGRFVKDCDKEIAKRLKEEKKLFFQGTLRHRYPFCWRSDTPLIYKAVTSWFMKVEEIKPQLLKAAEKVHWTPGHLKPGRFGKWLEGARDWAISRNRHWGTPIPLWRSADGEIHVVGSIAELEGLTGQKIEDLHRHFIDDLTFEKNGKRFKRIPEVFDCWFDTGCVPYGNIHYPFENKDQLKVPCDFVAEGIDQTRAWFYTTMILSVALFDEPAFLNVIANGILLAENGQKMSKRLKNYPEPDLMLKKYGADAVRLYMLHSPAVKADDLRFCERGVELVLRQILIPFWNAHAFFLTYARIYNWRLSGKIKSPDAIIDRWILAQLNHLIRDVEEGMDDYDLSRAVEPFVGFVDQLTNWYIRRSRRRFWADEDSIDRRQAFETLHFVLVELAKIAAPFVPFISEAIFQNLRSLQMAESVHLSDFPTYDGSMRDEWLEKGMDAVQTAVSLGHALRKEQKIKVRQPLPRVHVVSGDSSLLDFMKHEEHLIADELNVKEVLFHDERQRFVKLSIKPNFRVLGKKVGSQMKEAQAVIHNLEQDQINTLLQGVELPITLAGEAFILSEEDVEITREVHEGIIAMNAGVITIALETELTEDLVLEGIARELVNKINTMRREANYSVTDRISLKLGVTDKVRRALLIYEDYLKEEVLATSLDYGCEETSTKLDINGEPTAIWISKQKS